MKTLTRTIVILFLVLTVCLAGCPNQEHQAPGSQDADAGAGAGDFAALKITEEATQFLYTYLLADGSFQSVDKIQDVPEAARKQVVVVDTSLSPEKRQSSSILFIADLSNKRKDGTYPYSIVSRFRFERDLLREPAAKSQVLPPECASLPPSPADRAILYSTSWCGVCKTTSAFLRKEGIPFDEKDVEKDGKAQQEVACKALKTQTQVNGVPVLDIGGHLLLGFDRDQILEWWARLKNPPDKSPKPDSKSAPQPKPTTMRTL